MELSNLTLCYEAVQRIYRNAIVTTLRAKMKPTFPDDYLDRLRKPFGQQEWKQIEENAYGPQFRPSVRANCRRI